LNTTNCTALSCLRTIHYSTLNDAINATYIAGTSSFGPVIDGDFIQTYPSLQIASGAFVHVPLLAGANSDEGNSFIPSYGISTDAEFRTMVAAGGADAAAVATIEILYPNINAVGIPGPATYAGNETTYGTQFKRATAFVGDKTIISHRRALSLAWAREGVKTWSYRFNVVPAGIPDYIGATHFQEVAFVVSFQKVHRFSF
jgi:carboxylesterase type B